MATFYFDPELRGTPLDKVRNARISENSDSFKSGDIVEAWDHVFRWDDDCIPQRQMMIWRARGDELADAALPILQAHPGMRAEPTFLLDLKLPRRSQPRSRK